jgi:hypothetical protein|tara:strand:+ start:187 stop:357 length:171 start_codon:yes stop_codon:yes gene_type:complete
MANFLRVANTIRDNLNTKYHDGEFDDPANHDPKKEKKLDVWTREVEAPAPVPADKA